MRPGWKWTVALGLWCLLIATAQAITLYRTNSMALYTLEVPEGTNNAHPVDFIDPDSLAQLLASLQLDSQEAAGAIYLMSENQAIKAGSELAKALARVDQNRDVHLVTYRNVGSFPSARRLATAARVFVEGDRLNLIFGQIDVFIDEFREPYAKRAKPGNRSAVDLSGGSIRPADWFEFKTGRSDWVLFPIDMAQSPRTTLRLKPADKGVRAAPPEPPRPPVRSAPVAPAPPAAVPPANRWRDLEDGLETLQRLRDKGLISEDEYQAKRRALLDGVKL